jgi:hypothetical protein
MDLTGATGQDFVVFLCIIVVTYIHVMYDRDSINNRLNICRIPCRPFLAILLIVDTTNLHTAIQNHTSKRVRESERGTINQAPVQTCFEVKVTTGI